MRSIQRLGSDVSTKHFLWNYAQVFAPRKCLSSSGAGQRGKSSAPTISTLWLAPARPALSIRNGQLQNRRRERFCARSLQRTTAGKYLSIRTDVVLQRERAAYIKEYGEDEGDAFFRQEYHCDFSAAILGAIIARYVERAEREGRISDAVAYDPEGAPIEISADIGRTDTACWWFWQPKFKGFSIVDYDEGNGLDADEWCARLAARLAPYKLGKIWLPHDAQAKTFAVKHSALETFWKFFGYDKVQIVPQTSVQDRINAARTVIPRCEFNKALCADGIDGLNGWIYKWNDDLKVFSLDPLHNWASHPGDAFSYGAQMMRNRTVPKEAEAVRYPQHRTINEMVKSRTAKRLEMEG